MGKPRGALLLLLIVALVTAAAFQTIWGLSLIRSSRLSQSVLSEGTIGETPSPDPETECRKYSQCTWTGSTCSCNFTGESSGSPTSTYSPSASGTPFSYTTTSDTTTYSGDRLAQVDESTLSCMRTILTASEIDKLRFLQPTNVSEQQELENLKNKTAVCFQKYEETVKISEGGSRISQLPEATKECLINQIGREAFEQINGGFREPTQEEKLRGEVCFRDGKESVVSYQTADVELSKDIENCLALALGSKRYSEVSKGGATSLTLPEREKAARCFGEGPHPLEKKPVYQVPEKVNQCLVDALGEERVKKLESGQAEFTSRERTAAKACFEEIHPVQKRVLPVPPKAVPLLDESPEVIKITADLLEVVEVAPRISDRKLVFSGKALARSLVDIYIFSEPIVVTTQADENGDWVYRLNEPLQEGAHIAYAVVKDRSGESVRSSVYNFEARAAAEVSSPLLPEERASDASQKFILYSVSLTVVTLVVAGIVFIFVKKKIKPEGSPSGQGKGEGKDAT